MSQRLIAGCMTGTSLDGIDAALIRVHDHGLAMRVELIRTECDELGDLALALRRLAHQERITMADVARASLALGEAHAAVLERLIGDDRVDAVAVHGQTVYHDAAVTSQIINPHPIARRIGAPVAYDLRGADMAAGGGGAPITPLADYLMLREAGETRAIVNLGGFANYTRLPAGDGSLDAITGGDICACNQVLDLVARRRLKQPYDKDGAIAATGKVHEDAAGWLREIVSRQAGGGRSLGTGDEAAEWVMRYERACSGPDMAATACRVIGEQIADTIGEADRVIVAGGGALNATLVAAIAARAKAPVVSSDTLGIAVGYREAAAMAVLAAASLDGLPLTLPQITGRDPAATPKPAWVHP